MGGLERSQLLAMFLGSALVASGAATFSRPIFPILLGFPMLGIGFLLLMASLRPGGELTRMKMLALRVICVAGPALTVYSAAVTVMDLSQFIISESRGTTTGPYRLPPENVALWFAAPAVMVLGCALRVPRPSPAALLVAWVILSLSSPAAFALVKVFGAYSA